MGKIVTEIARSGPRSRQPELALGLGLVVDAEAGGGRGRQPLLGDLAAARLADAVGALLQPVQGRLDLEQLVVDLLQQGEVLLVLEGLAAEVAGVLVDAGQLVAVRARSLAEDALADLLEPAALLLQPLAC